VWYLWLAGHIANLANLHVPLVISSICGLHKGKVHPRTDHEDPEGEQRCSYTHSLTTAVYGGE
jgi:hypothetical protein